MRITLTEEALRRLQSSPLSGITHIAKKPNADGSIDVIVSNELWVTLCTMRLRDPEPKRRNASGDSYSAAIMRKL